MQKIITPQDVPYEEIGNFIQSKIGKDLQFVVVVFNEDSHRDFGTGCQQCASEALFHVAGELATRTGGEHGC
jgi:hypothetical protein